MLFQYVRFIYYFSNCNEYFLLLMPCNPSILFGGKTFQPNAKFSILEIITKIIINKKQ